VCVRVARGEEESGGAHARPHTVAEETVGNTGPVPVREKLSWSARRSEESDDTTVPPPLQLYYGTRVEGMYWRVPYLYVYST